MKNIEMGEVLAPKYFCNIVGTHLENNVILGCGMLPTHEVLRYLIGHMILGERDLNDVKKTIVLLQSLDKGMLN